MRRIVLTIALSCVPMAYAQTLYQCADGNGNRYQQTPCTGSVRLVRTLETSPEPPPTRQELEQRASKAAQDRAESAFLSHLAGTDDESMRYVRGDRSSRRRSVSRLPDACDRARARRMHRLADLTLDRSVDLFRRLDAAVAAACHGE
jgi:uncharacterized protein DUF4124